MPKVTFKYKKKRLYINLAMAHFWIALAIVALWEDNTIEWYNLGFLLAGTLYFIQFVWDVLYQYLNITDNFIRRNGVFVKKIRIKDITDIEKFAGGYTLKTKHKKLVINTNLVDEASISELETFIEGIRIGEDRYFHLDID
ncbi:hypothetical protein [Bizionia myxarmorum]|uniref:Uncharacterized protein n=1 Tax=Bizionia myxarmorum TaxID=291186 RepID=A0A5D0RDG0_9FLAO|nr:hypothetical protein [Bizionia myxarmorum]TYB78604.1 hypothetical protein ES674_02155 [Bizionia myxarmorum]